MELNFLQAWLLKDLRKASKTIDELEKSPTRYSVKNDIAQLIAMDLVDTLPLDRQPLYRCTSLGRALADMLQEQAMLDGQQPTPARTIPIPKEIYNPNDHQYGQYVRNGGNKHIPSRGL